MRTALVTGATRGIGRAVAGQLHERGHAVVVAGRTRASAFAAELGPPAIGVALDVADVESVERVRAAIRHVDIVVNNAAVLLDDDVPITDTDPQLLAEHFAINAIGALRVTQAFLPGMIARGWGRVVMLSSENGTIRGLQRRAPAYSASKAALNAITVLLAMQTENTGVLINAVSPGRVRTRMLPTGDRTPQEAATDVVEVATLPDDGPTGTFFRNGARIDW
jgi:NAD(P)-dependent dehydrogenase (short-subunit alcohol dehydrogenase family)